MFNVRPAFGFNVLAPVTPGFRVDPSGNLGALRDEGANSASWKGNPYVLGDLLQPYGIDLPTGRSPYSPASDDDYCRQVVRNCHTKCVNQYELLGGGLGPSWYRVCVRNCVAPSGCSF